MSDLIIGGYAVTLFGQRIVDADGAWVATELLSRGRRGEAQVSFPVLAEELARLGRQGDFDRWALQAALTAAEAGDREVHVNVETATLEDPVAAAAVVQTLAASPASSRLVVELTEGAMVTKPRTLARVLRAVQDTGARVALDDFGTHFSLPMLAALRPAISEVKLARELLQEVDTSPCARQVVEAQVRVLHKLGLRLVAEGIERLEQLRILADWGVERFQGFYFHRPEPLSGLLGG
jgi:EAL domain-containing protein (putative c-di-GMP-specific phosphodiesterase class I)